MSDCGVRHRLGISVVISDIDYEENLDDFDSRDWLEKSGPRLADQLDRFWEEEDRGGGYTEDWAEIFFDYRSSKNFECESCFASLKDHKHLLHVHQIDENKANNALENLMALCVLCHAEYHAHMWKDISEFDRNIILELRREPFAPLSE